MTVAFGSPEEVGEDDDMAVLDAMAGKSPSPAVFDKDEVAVVSPEQDSSNLAKSGGLSQPPSSIRVVAPPANAKDDTLVLQGRRLLSSAGPGHNSSTNPPLLASISEEFNEEDFPCHTSDSSLPRQHPASIFLPDVPEVQLAEEQVCNEYSSSRSRSRSPGDAELFSLKESEYDLTKESDLNGPEGGLTEETDLHPDIINILQFLFSYSSGKPFQFPSSGYKPIAKLSESGYHVLLERVAASGVVDESLLIVNWRNIHQIEGGSCLIHGKGSGFQNKTITWQWKIQKCFLFGKHSPREVRQLALKEADSILSASLSETSGSKKFRESHGKQRYTEYIVTSIPGDGRCLFRSVAHGSSLRCGSEAPDESQQVQMADHLRQKVADELVKRRSETEWFIEGDFDVYVNLIRQPHVWGGEPEILMLTYVLEAPITVYMVDQKAGDGLIAICEYGQEYGLDNPIRVLYDGFAHYEALQVNFSRKLRRLAVDG